MVEFYDESGALLPDPDWDPNEFDAAHRVAEAIGAPLPPAPPPAPRTPSPLPPAPPAKKQRTNDPPPDPNADLTLPTKTEAEQEEAAAQIAHDRAVRFARLISPAPANEGNADRKQRKEDKYNLIQDIANRKQ
jgi:hypothetical protein